MRTIVTHSGGSVYTVAVTKNPSLCRLPKPMAWGAQTRPASGADRGDILRSGRSTVLRCGTWPLWAESVGKRVGVLEADAGSAVIGEDNPWSAHVSHIPQAASA